MPSALTSAEIDHSQLQSLVIPAYKLELTVLARTQMA
jgi:hypothetical protein